MYYGVGEAPAKRDSHETDIDSPQFMAEKYLAELLQSKHIDELMTESNQRISEMKGLDSDLQMLVYENYNKFITATDTIKVMKSNVDSMDSDMQRLQSNMAEISNCSVAIHAKIGERRRKIEDMTEAFVQLKKLQFLLELPGRLRQCIEMRAYSQAVKYYLAASRILEQYSHLESFQKIVKDCRGPMEELKARMRSSVTFVPIVTKEEIRQKEIEKMQHNVQATQDGKRKKKPTKAEPEKKEKAAEPDPDDVSAIVTASMDHEVPSNRLSELGEYVQYLGQLGQNTADLRSAFLNARKAILEKSLQDWTPMQNEPILTCVQRLNARFMPRLQWTCRVFIPMFPELDHRKEFVSWMRDVTSQYLQAMRNLLSAGEWSSTRVTAMSQSSSNEFNDALLLVAEDVRKIAAFFPESFLEESLANTISNVVRARVRGELDDIAAKLLKFIDDQINASTVSNDMFDVPDLAWLKEAIQNAVLFFDPLIFNNECLKPGHRKSLVQVVAAILADFVPFNVEAILQKYNTCTLALPTVENLIAPASKKSKHSRHPSGELDRVASTSAIESKDRHASDKDLKDREQKDKKEEKIFVSSLASLRLSQVCLGIARHGVPQIAKVLKPYVVAMENTDFYTQSTADKTCERLVSLSRSFLTQFAEIRSRELCDTLRKSLDSFGWFDDWDVKDVSDSVVRMVRDLLSMDRRLKAAFPATIMPNISMSASSLSSASSSSVGSSGPTSPEERERDSLDLPLSSSSSVNSGLNTMIGGEQRPRRGTVTRAHQGVGAEVDKVFTRGLAQFSLSAPSFGHASVMSFVLKVLYKTWCELVRNNALSESARLQMVVDVEFLRLKLTSVVGDMEASVRSAVEALLESVLSTSEERCFSRAALRQDVVTKVVKDRASRE
jgi:hypothetical protein